jgi:hypothetical protein
MVDDRLGCGAGRTRIADIRSLPAFARLGARANGRNSGVVELETAARLVGSSRADGAASEPDRDALVKAAPHAADVSSVANAVRHGRAGRGDTDRRRRHPLTSTIDTAPGYTRIRSGYGPKALREPPLRPRQELRPQPALPAWKRTDGRPVLWRQRRRVPLLGIPSFTCDTTTFEKIGSALLCHSGHG